MNFLRPLAALRSPSARAEDTAPATARPQAAAIRARRPGAAAASASASRVNVSTLNRFEDGAEVDAAALLDAGVLSKCVYGVKILGNGSLEKKLTVKASAFSESAKQKIEAAGGKAEVV